MGYDDAVTVLQTLPKSRYTSSLVAKPDSTVREVNIQLLPQSFACSALKSSYFESAWKHLQPWSGTTIGYGWLPEFASLHASGTAINYAFSAVALHLDGRRTQNDVLVRQSYAAYTRALRWTQIQLGDERTMSTDETFAGLLLLALFEV